ncbi:MAG: cupin domain-containing protein, partial [Alphaproteobacteria bacterium]|nr:cupin domain-containing protein [Alphaproteobacteria bacterium]
MSTSSIRFQPGGPAGVGLEPWGAKPAASLERGDAVQHGHMYFEDAALGLSAGIWDCTPFVGKPRAHGCNEFMIILEGSVTIRPESGSATTVRAGQSFFLPKGLRMQWEQPERVRKYFVIYDGPADAPAPAAAPPLIIDPAAKLAPSTPPAPEALFGA